MVWVERRVNVIERGIGYRELACADHVVLLSDPPALNVFPACKLDVMNNPRG
jgi:hypothetical protein